MLFDTHLHLIDRKRLSYPWLEEVLALNKDASYTDYARTAQRVGIKGALHMEVDVAADEHRAETQMVEDLMAREESLLRGAIASCRPEDRTFPQYLEETLTRSSVLGFRRVLHVIPDAVSQTDLFRENLRLLGNTNLTFDLCVLARQLKIGTALIDTCPDVSFILDHCGVPEIAANKYDDWARDIAQLAERPNVTAKISGVIAYANPENWTLSDIRPYVEHTIECFGWDRVVWGSDSPVCTLGGNIETWVAATHALIAGCSKSEKAQFMHGNAKRIWSLS